MQRRLLYGRFSGGVVTIMPKSDYDKMIHREHERLRRLAFPEKYRSVIRKYYEKNKHKYLPAARVRARAWNRANKALALKNALKWARANPEKRAASRKKWSDKNPTFKADYQRNRLRIDPAYRVLAALRRRVYGAVNKTDKSAKTKEMLGCSIEDFMIYLESKFGDGMTRENYGSVWEVDHIMPCEIFDLTKPEHQKRCFHFSNLQPLFCVDNKKKGCKVLSDQFQLL